MPSNYAVIDKDGWIWICNKIKEKYPKMAAGTFEVIVENGTLGKYNKMENFAINAACIFRWIKCYLNTKYKVWGNHVSQGTISGAIWPKKQFQNNLLNTREFTITEYQEFYDI